MRIKFRYYYILLSSFCLLLISPFSMADPFEDYLMEEERFGQFRTLPKLTHSTWEALNVVIGAEIKALQARLQAATRARNTAARSSFEGDVAVHAKTLSNIRRELSVLAHVARDQIRFTSGMRLGTGWSVEACPTSWRLEQKPHKAKIASYHALVTGLEETLLEKRNSLEAQKLQLAARQKAASDAADILAAASGAESDTSTLIGAAYLEGIEALKRKQAAIEKEIQEHRHEQERHAQIKRAWETYYRQVLIDRGTPPILLLVQGTSLLGVKNSYYWLPQAQPASAKKYMGTISEEEEEEEEEELERAVAPEEKRDGEPSLAEEAVMPAVQQMEDPFRHILFPFTYMSSTEGPGIIDREATSALRKRLLTPAEFAAVTQLGKTFHALLALISAEEEKAGALERELLHGKSRTEERKKK
jgi:hypothetical protein